MKVKFKSDAIAVLEKGPTTLFAAGDVQDLNPASAERWIRRGVAEPAGAEPALESVEVVDKKPKKGKKGAADSGEAGE